MLKRCYFSAYKDIIFCFSFDHQYIVWCILGYFQSTQFVKADTDKQSLLNSSQVEYGSGAGNTLK